MHQIVTEKQQIDLMNKIQKNIHFPDAKGSTCGRSSEHGVKSHLKCFQRKPSTASSHNQRIHNNENILPLAKFTARPLNKQILSSKGDISVFRYAKREVTKPMIHFSDAKSSSCGRSSEHGVKPHLKCFQRQPSIASSHNQRIHNNENILPKFTARPLNKQILSSKGDIGVIRCAKREVTKPMEFNLSSNKRSQQDLPTELFEKKTCHPMMELTENKSW